MRTVIVGGSRSGKSTLARELRVIGIPTFCCDPRSTVKEPEEDVTYLPEDLGIAGDDGPSVWIAEHWFTMPGPWCVEGWGTARTLRRWMGTHAHVGEGLNLRMPCDEIIVFRKQHEHAITKPGQRAQGKGVMTVWDSIAYHFTKITEYR